MPTTPSVAAGGSTDTDDRRWLSRAEAARRLSVTDKTVASWAKQGRITEYRFGPSSHRYDAAEIDALIASSRRAPGSSATAEDPEVSAIRAERAARLAEHVERALADAPPLTAEQKLRIASILTRPTGSGR